MALISKPGAFRPAGKAQINKSNYFAQGLLLHFCASDPHLIGRESLTNIPFTFSNGNTGDWSVINDRASGGYVWQNALTQPYPGNTLTISAYDYWQRNSAFTIAWRANFSGVFPNGGNSCGLYFSNPAFFEMQNGGVPDNVLYCALPLDTGTVYAGTIPIDTTWRTYVARFASGILYTLYSFDDDGNIVSSSSAGAVTGNLVFNTGAGALYGFQGQFDFFAIWNYAMSDAQVGQMIQQRSNLISPVPRRNQFLVNTPSGSVNMTGVTATGQVGSIGVTTSAGSTVNMSGVGGTGQIGSFGLKIDASVNLAGLTTTGQIGSFAVAKRAIVIDIYPNVGSTPIPLTLDNLGNGLARQSTAVINNRNYDDVLVRLQIQGTTSSAGPVDVYLYGADEGANFVFSDSTSGTDAPFTLPVLGSHYLGRINVVGVVPATSALFSVANAAGGVVPDAWGLIVVNRTGAALGTGNTTVYQAKVLTFTTQAGASSAQTISLTGIVGVGQVGTPNAVNSSYVPPTKTGYTLARDYTFGQTIVTNTDLNNAFYWYLFPGSTLGAPFPQAIAGSNYGLVIDEEFSTLDLGTTGSHAWYQYPFSEALSPRANILDSNSVLNLKWVQGQNNNDTSISEAAYDRSQGTGFYLGYIEAFVKWDVVAGAVPYVGGVSLAHILGTDLFAGQEQFTQFWWQGDGSNPTNFKAVVQYLTGTFPSYSVTNTGNTSTVAAFTSAAFHKIGILWTAGNVQFFLDDVSQFTCTVNANTDTHRDAMALVLGAAWDGVTGGGDPGATTMNLFVDYIRVWQAGVSSPVLVLGNDWEQLSSSATNRQVSGTTLQLTATLPAGTTGFNVNQHVCTPSGLPLLSGLAQTIYNQYFGYWEANVLVQKARSGNPRFLAVPNAGGLPPVVGVAEWGNNGTLSTTSSIHPVYTADGSHSSYSNTVAQYNTTTDVYTPAFDYSLGYHTVGMDWNAGELTNYVDGVLITSRSFNWTTNSGKDPGPAGAVLVMAIGSAFGGDPQATSNFPQTLLAQFIRLWQKNPPPPPAQPVTPSIGNTNFWLTQDMTQFVAGGSAAATTSAFWPTGGPAVTLSLPVNSSLALPQTVLPNQAYTVSVNYLQSGATAGSFQLVYFDGATNHLSASFVPSTTPQIATFGLTGAASSASPAVPAGNLFTSENLSQAPWAPGGAVVGALSAGINLVTFTASTRGGSLYSTILTAGAAYRVQVWAQRVSGSGVFNFDVWDGGTKDFYSPSFVTTTSMALYSFDFIAPSMTGGAGVSIVNQGDGTFPGGSINFQDAALTTLTGVSTIGLKSNALVAANLTIYGLKLELGPSFTPYIDPSVETSPITTNTNLWPSQDMTTWNGAAAVTATSGELLNSTAQIVAFGATRTAYFEAITTTTNQLYTYSVRYLLSGANVAPFEINYWDGNSTNNYSIVFTPTNQWQVATHSFRGVANPGALNSIGLVNNSPTTAGSVVFYGHKLEVGGVATAYVDPNLPQPSPPTTVPQPATTPTPIAGQSFTCIYNEDFVNNPQTSGFWVNGNWKVAPIAPGSNIVWDGNTVDLMTDSTTQNVCLTTSGIGDFTPGYVEIRAKFSGDPKQTVTLSLLSDRHNNFNNTGLLTDCYNGAPNGNSFEAWGEWTIASHIGGTQIITTQATQHWAQVAGTCNPATGEQFDQPASNTGSQTLGQVVGAGNQVTCPGVDFSQFHTYGFLWTPGSPSGTLQWYLDNQLMTKVVLSTNLVFPAGIPYEGVIEQQPYFIALRNFLTGTPNTVPQHLTVDFVRVWQKISTIPTLPAGNLLSTEDMTISPWAPSQTIVIGPLTSGINQVTYTAGARGAALYATNLTAGSTYTWQVWAQAVSGAPIFNLSNWDGGAGNLYSPNCVPTSQMQLFSFTFVAPTNAGGGVSLVNQNSGTFAGGVINFQDAALVLTPLGPPVANNFSSTVVTATATVIAPNVTGPFTSVTVVTQPTHGTVTANGITFTYQSGAGFTGVDAFTYTATNSAGVSNVARCSITVSAQISGRTWILGIYDDTSANPPSPWHTFLGYYPDYSYGATFQTHTPGGGFFIPAGNYPIVIDLDMSLAFGNDYANIANGVRDTQIKATINSLAGGGVSLASLYAVRIDSEFNYNLNFPTGIVDPTTYQNAWNHVKALCQAVYPARVKYIFNPNVFFSVDGAGHRIDAYVPSNADIIGIDAYTTTGGSNSAAIMGSATTVGSVLWWTSIAKTLGKPIGLPEWGDGIGDGVYINAIGAWANNSANNVVLLGYWASTVGSGGSVNLNGAGARTAFASNFANVAAYQQTFWAPTIATNTSLNASADF